MREILHSPLSARSLAVVLARESGVTVTHSQISRIRRGERWRQVDRAGTRFDPSLLAQQPRAPKRWRVQPVYVTRSGKLKPGYELRPIIDEDDAQDSHEEEEHHD